MKANKTNENGQKTRLQNKWNMRANRKWKEWKR